jgi:hypothetical protein
MSFQHASSFQLPASGYFTQLYSVPSNVAIGAVRDGQAAEVVPTMRSRPARPQFLPGLSVERVEPARRDPGMRRAGPESSRRRMTAAGSRDVRNDLRRIFAAA